VQPEHWLAFVAASTVLLILPGPTILLVLGSIFVVLAALNAGAYAIFASAARGLLTSARAQRNLNLAGGWLMSAAGVWALLPKRPAP
jgi:threonine/homoserine/homoserine lactone efflux protein